MNTKPLQGVYEYDAYEYIKSEFYYFLYEGAPSSPPFPSSSFQSYHTPSTRVMFNTYNSCFTIDRIPAGMAYIYAHTRYMNI